MPSCCRVPLTYTHTGGVHHHEVDAQLLAQRLGKLGVKAGPLAVLVLVVHGLVLGDAHCQHTGSLNIGQIGLGGGVFLFAVLFVAGAGGEAGHNAAHQYQAQHQRKHFFHLAHTIFSL